MLSSSEVESRRSDLSVLRSDESVYFRVPFQEALEVVRKRQVLIEKGRVILPFTLIKETALPDMFRIRLSEKLAETTRKFSSAASSFSMLNDVFKEIRNSDLRPAAEREASKRTGKQCCIGDIEDLPYVAEVTNEFTKLASAEPSAASSSVNLT